MTTGKTRALTNMVSPYKSHMLGFSITWTKNFQMSKLSLEKAEEPESNCRHSLRKQGNSRKASTSVSLTTLKPLTVWSWHSVRSSEVTGVTRPSSCLLRTLHEGQRAAVRTLCATTDWFQIERGIGQGFLLSACLLTYMLSTSWEMLGWSSYKLESR